MATLIGAELKAFEGERDHAHLMVVYPPKVAVARLVNSLKGASSRVLRKQVPGIARHYWEGRALEPVLLRRQLRGHTPRHHSAVHRQEWPR